jgi:LPS sulfotransferase NodH
MICSMQRSGSTLLVHMLADTMLAGAPAEYLMQEVIEMLKRRWDIERFDDYLRELLARKTSPNGVFGVKAQWEQYALAIGERDPKSLFPDMRFIHLRREDRVRQAVSWVRALQTQRWFAVDGRDRATPEFDRERITKIARRIAKGEAAWESTFERHGITPYRLTYEELAAAPVPTARAVLEFVGVEVPDALLANVPMQRQADELSEEWVARYLEESPAPS